MKRLALAAAIGMALVTPAAAQLQPGPNLYHGVPFTWRPRPPIPARILYGLAPPAGLVEVAPPFVPAPALPPAPPLEEVCVVDPADIGHAPILNVRASPNGLIIGALPNGAQVVIRSYAGNWADIGFGFVFRPLLYCPPPPPPMAYGPLP